MSGKSERKHLEHGPIIANVPCLDGTVTAVTVERDWSADVVLSSVQPETAMKGVRRWEQVHIRDEL